MNDAVIAADANLHLDPTPRSYLAVLEAWRARRIVVFPSVDGELRRYLAVQGKDFME